MLNRPAGIPSSAGCASFAAIDLGTNNCRLLVAVPASRGFRVVDSYSRIVRLGEGLGVSGLLGPAGMDRTLEALRACAARLARRPGIVLRAVATEACRRARNGAVFLDRVRGETGIRLDVISPREEAELALESCAPLLDPRSRRALLFDIGGGSTELAWTRLAACGTPELAAYVSLPLGVVQLSEQHGDHAFTPDGYDAMVAEAAEQLRDFERTHRIAQELRAGGVQFLGTSGTVTTLAGEAMRLPRYSRPLVDGSRLSGPDAGSALRRLRALGANGLRLHPCVGPDRLDFVLPGCAIFEAIQRTWAFPSVTVADRGLREGIITRLIREARRRRGAPHRDVPTAAVPA